MSALTENMSSLSTSLEVSICSNDVVLSVPTATSVRVSDENFRTMSLLLSTMYVTHHSDTIDEGRSPVNTDHILYVISKTHIVPTVSTSG